MPEMMAPTARSHRSLAGMFKSTTCLSLARKDTFIVETAGGIIYMVYSYMQASLSTLCIQIYDLGQLGWTDLCRSILALPS